MICELPLSKHVVIKEWLIKNIFIIASIMIILICVSSHCCDIKISWISSANSVQAQAKGGSVWVGMIDNRTSKPHGYSKGFAMDISLVEPTIEIVLGYKKVAPGAISVGVPFFLVALAITISYNAYRMIIFWLRHSKAHPQCEKCGYDLSGIQSNRCPECGASIDAAVQSRWLRRGLRRG